MKKMDRVERKLRQGRLPADRFALADWLEEHGRGEEAIVARVEGNLIRVVRRALTLSAGAAFRIRCDTPAITVFARKAFVQTTIQFFREGPLGAGSVLFMSMRWLEKRPARTGAGFDEFAFRRARERIADWESGFGDKMYRSGAAEAYALFRAHWGSAVVQGLEG